MISTHEVTEWIQREMNQLNFDNSNHSLPSSYVQTPPPALPEKKRKIDSKAEYLKKLFMLNKDEIMTINLWFLGKYIRRPQDYQDSPEEDPDGKSLGPNGICKEVRDNNSTSPQKEYNIVYHGLTFTNTLFGVTKKVQVRVPTYTLAKAIYDYLEPLFLPLIKRSQLGLVTLPDEILKEGLEEDSEEEETDDDESI